MAENMFTGYRKLMLSTSSPTSRSMIFKKIQDSLNKLFLSISILGSLAALFLVGLALPSAIPAVAHSWTSLHRASCDEYAPLVTALPPPLYTAGNARECFQNGWCTTYTFPSN